MDVIDETGLRWIGAGAVLLAFGIDLVTPLGVCDGLLYSAALSIGLVSSDMRLIFHLGFLATAATMLGYFFSPPGAEAMIVMSNRGLSFALIWLLVFVCYKSKKVALRR